MKKHKFFYIVAGLLAWPMGMGYISPAVQTPWVAVMVGVIACGLLFEGE